MFLQVPFRTPWRSLDAADAQQAPAAPIYYARTEYPSWPAASFSHSLLLSLRFRLHSPNNLLSHLHNPTLQNIPGEFVFLGTVLSLCRHVNTVVNTWHKASSPLTARPRLTRPIAVKLSRLLSSYYFYIIKRKNSDQLHVKKFIGERKFPIRYFE